MEFEAIAKSISTDIEFSILQNLTCTNKHFGRIIKADDKLSKKNRYFKIRPFEHSMVVLKFRQQRSRLNTEDAITNLSNESDKINSEKNEEFSNFEKDDSIRKLKRRKK